MTIATRTDTLVSPTITQVSLFDGIKLAFTNAGFTATFDDFVSSTDRIVVYAVVLDNTKAFGTTYIRIRVTNTLTINQTLFSTWNATAHTGTNPGTETAYAAIVTNAPLNFLALNGGDEYKFVIVWSSTITITLGFIAPTNKPAWWDLNAWNYCFVPTDITYNIFHTTALTPFPNVSNTTSLNVPFMSAANLQTNRRDILPGIIFYSNTNRGIAARTSDDLIMVASGGTSRFDIIQIPGDTKQYLLLSNVAGGLAIRFA